VPFGQAKKLIKEILGVEVSKATAVRLTEAAGAAYEKIQTEKAEWIERESPPAPKGLARMMISVDGAMVPLRHGEWGEVKTLVIGEVTPKVKERGEWVVHTRELSYFSRMVTSEIFQTLTLVEMHRRGVWNCQQAVAVMDGAEWEQNFIDYHRHDAVRILDFPHAAQRIGQIGKSVYGESNPKGEEWTKKCLHKLKHEGADALLVELRELKENRPELEVIGENLAYLEKRKEQMNYPEFQSEGWPIGSGCVESANKLVVEFRMKGAGMHWERKNVNPLLGLRNIVCNDRWSEEWPKIERQLIEQARNRRKQLHDKHFQEKKIEPQLPEKKDQEKLINIPEEQSNLQLVDKKNKPAPNHPWRHSPIGRARYQPSNLAKN
jgi:hypothetical protein